MSTRSCTTVLVSIEFKLTQSLMNKRLEVKDNSLARTFATKDLEVSADWSVSRARVSRMRASLNKGLQPIGGEKVCDVGDNRGSMHIVSRLRGQK